MMKRRGPQPPSVIEARPNPSYIELDRTSDILRADGFTAEAAEYGRRARVAERIEDRIQETGHHVRSLEHAYAQAQRDFPDEVSYDEHLPGMARDQERGEHIVRWLLEHGWTPPEGLAFAAPAESEAARV